MSSPPLAPPAGRRGVRAWRGLLLQLALLAAIITAAVIWVDLPTVFRQIASLSPIALAAALGIALACRFLMGFKWRQLVMVAGGQLPLSLAVSVYFQSAFSSRLVSTGVGGDLLRAWLVGRSGVPGGIVLGSIALEKTIALVSNVALATIGGLYLILHVRAGAQDLLLWLIGGGMAVGLAAAVLLLYTPAHSFAASLLKRLPARVAGLGERTSAAVLGYRRSPAALAINFLLAALEQLLQTLKLFVIGNALGIDLAAAEFFAALLVVLFARRVAGYVEGLGLAEGVSVIALTLVGVAPETAVALAVTNYAISTVALLPGGYLLWGNRPREARRQRSSTRDTPPFTGPPRRR